MSDAERVLAYLDRLGIGYRVAEHPPTGAMAECAAVDETLGALTPKNLFLTTKNGKRFCLCLTRPDARFRTADVSKQAGYSRLSFAPEEALIQRLRCRGGSASPLGLIFDEAREVALLVDSRLYGAPVLGFHPCDNTRTLALSASDFFDTFLPSLGVAPVEVEIREG